MIESQDSKKSKKAIEPISDEFHKKLIASVNYCYACNRCNIVCPTAYLGTFYPRNLITDITFLPVKEALENNKAGYEEIAGNIKRKQWSKLS